MILSELREYIQQHQQVSLADLVNRFDSNEAALRQMLDVWIAKGKIHKRLTTASCGSSCNQCNQSSTEYYCWGKAPAQEIQFMKPDCGLKLN